MLQKFLVVLLMAGLTVVAAADTVYKWSDSRGQVHFTDLPPTQADAKVIGVYHQESSVLDEDAEDGAGDEGDSGDEPAAQTSGNEPAEPSIDRAAMAAVLADVANSKVKQCKEAKERYQRYVESQRLFRETPDGKREYLTDKELTEARLRAKQSVDEYCS
jgi:hypothetical protein